MNISIIIPVYNEENNIQIFYDAVKASLEDVHKSYELVFINDGSSDQSLAVLKRLSQQDRNVKIICFDKNYGQTAALDAGFKQASGEIILTIDADLQYDPKDSIRIIAELACEDVDAVLGRRIKRNSGLFKYLCSQVAIFIRNAVLNESWQDSSFAGYKRRCLEGLTLYKDTQVFLPMLLRIKGHRIKEIDVMEHPRKNGRSKYNLRNRFLKRLYSLLVMKWLKESQLTYKVDKIINQ